MTSVSSIYISEKKEEQNRESVWHICKILLSFYGFKLGIFYFFLNRASVYFLKYHVKFIFIERVCVWYKNKEICGEYCPSLAHKGVEAKQRFNVIRIWNKYIGENDETSTLFVRARRVLRKPRSHKKKIRAASNFKLSPRKQTLQPHGHLSILFCRRKIYLIVAST